MTPITDTVPAVTRCDECLTALGDGVCARCTKIRADKALREYVRQKAVKRQEAQVASKRRRPRNQEDAPTPIRRASARSQRNALCPCNSGKKYKKCCLKDRAEVV